MTKLILIPFTFACCLFFSFSFYESLGFNLNELPTADVILDKTLGTSLSELRKKYSLSIIGVGGSKKDKKEIMIGVSFLLNRSLSKDECRELLVDITEALLGNINQNEDLQPYLYYIPFPYRNLEVRIFLRNPDCSDISDPDISVISMINGGIEYHIYDRTIRYKFTTEEETYDKALEIVQTQRSERPVVTIPESTPAPMPNPEPEEPTFFQQMCQRIYNFFK